MTQRRMGKSGRGTRLPPAGPEGRVWAGLLLWGQCWHGGPPTNESHTPPAQRRPLLEATSSSPSLWALPRPPGLAAGRYLAGLSHRRPLLGAAPRHLQQKGLEPAWQGQLVVSGDAELGCCPQHRSHTVHRGLGKGEAGRAQQTGPVPAELPQLGPHRHLLRAWSLRPQIRV